MLPELAQALLQPKAYPEATGKIELVQTQMSFVFLTDEFVYKVKKPVNLGYLDYTSLTSASSTASVRLSSTAVSALRSIWK